MADTAAAALAGLVHPRGLERGWLGTESVGCLAEYLAGALSGSAALRTSDGEVEPTTAVIAF
jgi:hypothetical protein